MNEAAQRLGVSLKQTDDQLMRDMLAATASFINCVNGTDGDFPTEISRSDIDITIRALVGANAHTISENIEGADMFGTGPIRDAYFMYSSTDIIPDLERVTGFIPKAQYPSPMHALQAEWGSVSNLRMLVTSVGSTTPQASTLGNTVYNNFCLGLEAYAAIEQDGYSAQFLYRPPIYDSPLALNASVGWKMANARVITQDTWVINLRSTISFPTN